MSDPPEKQEIVVFSDKELHVTAPQQLANAHRQADGWQVEAVLMHGGEIWLPWAVWQNWRSLPDFDRRVHAIRFRNGVIWDAVNGWREVE